MPTPGPVLKFRGSHFFEFLESESGSGSGSDSAEKKKTELRYLTSINL